MTNQQHKADLEKVFSKELTDEEFNKIEQRLKEAYAGGNYWSEMEIIKQENK